MNGWMFALIALAVVLIVGPFATLKLAAKIEAMRAQRRAEREPPPK